MVASTGHVVDEHELEVGKAFDRLRAFMLARGRKKNLYSKYPAH
jgi:hypothetical protein